MSRFGILLLSLVFPLLSNAKESYYTRYNTDSFWRLLVLEPAGTPLNLSASDTVILVASNRAAGKDSLRFMSELRGDGSIRYFVVYVRAGKWRIHPVASLRAALQAMPDKTKDWVVYTEGMGKIFTTDLDRGFSLAKSYGVNVLLLDYPSINSRYKSYRNFRFVLRNSNIAYKDFAPVLDTLRGLRREGLTGSGALSMFFHSMGNNVIRNIGRRELRKQLNGELWVDNIILNAPCVPRRRSHRWIDSLQFARRIYVHYNPQDRTLKWSRIAGFRGILGERPLARTSPKATYINFNTLCGDGHSNFLSFSRRMTAKPESVAHYKLLLHGKAPDIREGAGYRKSIYGVGWDLLPREQ